jgi:Dual-action HEIGH metallo-peptidase
MRGALEDIAMFARISVLAVVCGILASGCVDKASETQPNETQEIIDNLVKAGFPSNDIQVVEGVVYVGRDATVSLAASREMSQGGTSGEEQYRTNNIIFPLPKICINAPAFVGVFGTALDLAIQNYNEQQLSFGMVRPPDGGCNFTINAVLQPGPPGGSAGFPSGGLPFGTITINDGLGALGVDTIEHVITHELGHTVGFRHADFFNRSISCGTGGNEGDAGVGANHIPGTPTGAVVGGSIMNSCFRSFETGEFTGSDVTALQEVYRGGCNETSCFLSCKRAGFCDGSCTSNSGCICFGRRPCP